MKRAAPIVAPTGFVTLQSRPCDLWFDRFELVTGSQASAAAVAIFVEVARILADGLLLILPSARIARQGALNASSCAHQGTLSVKQ